MLSSSTDRSPVREHSLVSFVLAIILVLGPGVAAAQDPTTGDPEPRVASASRRMEIPLERVAASITVIGRDEIERRQWRTLPDLLRAVPGLHVVQAGGVGKQTSVFMRGAESNHTLVLLDGIEVSDPSLPGGVFDIAHLLTEGVERVEILRGPHSTLYGSDAVGGVINVVSRKGRGRLEASAWVEAGGFNTVQNAAALRGSFSRFDYSLAHTNLHTRGINSFTADPAGHERDGYDNRTTSARLGFAQNGALRFDLLGHFIDTDNELDPFREDRDNRGATRQLFLRWQGQLDLAGGAWKQTFGVSYSDHDRSGSNDSDPQFADVGEESFDGRRLKLDWQHDLQLGSSHVLTLGLETERESLRSRSRSSDSFSSFEAQAHASGRTSAAFLQEQFAIGDWLFGTLALRLDHHDEFGSELTYRAAAAYLHPRSGTKLRASIATAFKAPSLDDLFGESVASCCGGLVFPFVGNPDLEPEKSRGFEIGVEQSLWDGRLVLGTTYFQNRIRNLIQATAAFDTVENVARARTDGFETFVSLRLEDRLVLHLDHTYTMAEDRESGEDLLRRPTHKLGLRAELRPLPQATVSLGVIYTGRRKDIDALSFGRTTKGGFTRVDLAATYRITPRWGAFGRIDNLFDREYSDPDGFEGAGIAGYVGVRAEY